MWSSETDLRGRTPRRGWRRATGFVADHSAAENRSRTALAHEGGPLMADPERCPNCGSERPARAPQGMCPRCLLRQALDCDAPGPSGDDGPAATPGVPLGAGGPSVLATIAATAGP